MGFPPTEQGEFYYDREEATYKMEYTGGDDNDIEAGIKTPLEGNGDFRNQECLDLLDECDIVVTNPPFSCYRPYVATLMEHKKKFIIWSNNNSITYKEIFPLLKNNEMWLGYTANKTLVFRIPDTYEKWDEKETQKMNDGNHYAKVPAISVFTNLDIEKRHEKLILWKNYTPEEYPRFDELPDVINVNKVQNIPVDFDGLMAVPITFLDKYNPEQFEIVDALNRYTILDYFGVNEDIQNRHSHCCNINGKSTYYRIVIRKKVGV